MPAIDARANQNPGWTVRSATADDVPLTLALWRAAESPPSATDDETGLSRLFDRDPGSLLLAEAGGQVVGSLIAAWDGWRGSFYRLAVDPDWRRRGVASALVRAGEERLRALGAVRLTAIVVERDRAALELWSAVGYQAQEERVRFVRMVPATEGKC